RVARAVCRPRWPLISSSSRAPPSDMRTNSRLSARAIDSPIEVFPVPGGPISVRIAPERLSSALPRSPRRPEPGQDRPVALPPANPTSLPQLAHGQVLDDPLLHVLEAGVVGVEDL